MGGRGVTNPLSPLSTSPNGREALTWHLAQVQDIVTQFQATMI